MIHLSSTSNLDGRSQTDEFKAGSTQAPNPSGQHPLAPPSVATNFLQKRDNTKLSPIVRAQRTLLAVEMNVLPGSIPSSSSSPLATPVRTPSTTTHARRVSDEMDKRPSQIQSTSLSISIPLPEAVPQEHSTQSIPESKRNSFNEQDSDSVSYLFFLAQ